MHILWENIFNYYFSDHFKNDELYFWMWHLMPQMAIFQIFNLSILNISEWTKVIDNKTVLSIFYMIEYIKIIKSSIGCIDP